MNKHGTYTSNKRKPNTSGLGEFADKDLLQELVERGVMKDIIGEYSGSDMNDDELVHAIQKMYQWGISSGRKLAEGVIKRIDDRQWEMVASRLDQFEQSFTNRAKRQFNQRIKTILKGGDK